MDINVLAILFLVIVAPLWIIFHYTSKARESRNLTPDDEKMLEDLWRSAKKMERRIDALESVLDLDRRETADKRPAPEHPAADRLM